MKAFLFVVVLFVALFFAQASIRQLLENNGEKQVVKDTFLDLYGMDITNTEQINKLISKSPDIKNIDMAFNSLSDLNGLQLPNKLEYLNLVSNPIKDYSGLKLPASLQKLIIGVDEAKIQALNDLSSLSLNTNLDSLYLVGIKEPKWDSLKLPNKLNELIIDTCSITELEGIHFPPSLKRLKIVDNQLNEKENWSLLPKSLNYLLISEDNIKNISKVKFPENITELQISSKIDIDDVKFPPALKSFTSWLHESFSGKNLPETVEELYFYTDECPKIDVDIQWPSKLKVLVFEGTDYQTSKFSTEIKDFKFPKNILRLDLLYQNISSLEGLKLPAGLKELDLAGNLITDISGLTEIDLPQSLEKLVLFDNPIDEVDYSAIYNYYKKANPRLEIFIDDSPEKEERIRV